MIDNFLGIDTEWGDTGHYGFCHIMRHAVMILLFYKGQVKSPIITQGMSQSSMFLTFRTICNFRERTSALGRVGGGKGGIPGRLYYEACLKTQPAHKPLIHHDEKHDFFFQAPLACGSCVLPSVLFLLFDQFCYHGNQLLRYVYTSVWSIAIDILSYRQMLRVQQ